MKSFEFGIDRYFWALYDVNDLPTGSYKAIIKVDDPYTGTETYSVNSADTVDLTINPAYSWIGFEDNERRPLQNTIIFNNCCSSVNGLHVANENITYLRAHSGVRMFKLTGYDSSSDETYDCVDCKLFDNCGIAITTPTFLSCWIKATEAPGNSETLYVSLDGIIVDQNYTWQQLKNWTKYGKMIDQNGDPIHSGYHPVPVDSQWHYYVFSLNPAAGDTIKILQFSYWGVPSTATGQFTAYLDDISISSNHPWNMWYGETFANGGSGHSNSDPNFELDFASKSEDGKPCYGGARLIVDGHGDGGEGSHWILPTPGIRKDIHPYIPISQNTCMSWMQKDKSHALILGLLIDDKWLYYAWNASNHWDEQGYVDMGDEMHTPDYNKWMTFNIKPYTDYVAEYPSAPAPQEIKAYRIMHYCKSDWDADSGGTVIGPVFTDGGNQTPGANAPIVIRPNGGERWASGCKHLYQHKVGGDLPKRIAVWWTRNYNVPNPSWELIDIRDFPPLSPPLEYTGAGVWVTPLTGVDLPYCAFKTQGISMSGAPLSAQTDVSDSTFTVTAIGVRRNLEWDRGIQLTAQIPGSHPDIQWIAEGQYGVHGIDLFYTTMGGLSREELMTKVMTSGGESIWNPIATGLAPGTWCAVDSLLDPVGDTMLYEYGYLGCYSNWTVPNKPTSGGNLKVVAYDTLGDTAVYMMQGCFNIPFTGGTQFATAYTADKIATDGGAAHLVFADSSGSVVYSSNPDGYEWSTPEIVGQGSLPTVQLDDGGEPCVSWVTGQTNYQNVMYTKKNSGTWQTPTNIAPQSIAGLTRYSEPTLRYAKDDSVKVAVFKAQGTMSQQTPIYTHLGLINTRFAVGTPLTRHTDTLWGAVGSFLSPLTTAPAYIIDSEGNEHLAFTYDNTTTYIQSIAGAAHLESITTVPALWPSLTCTQGNVYLDYGVAVSGSTRMVRKWKHPSDTFWRSTDTIFKGSLERFTTVGGALSLLERTGSLTRLSYDPVERKIDTVDIADSVSYGHAGLSYNALSSGLPLVWTQRSGSSYYVNTDWHDAEGTLFPDYYMECGKQLTAYTVHRDTVHQYYNVCTDVAADTLVYELPLVDSTRPHTLFVEFYFDDDSIPERSFIITAGDSCETLAVYSRFRQRTAIGLPAGASSLRIEMDSDTGGVEVSRIMLYQAEEGGQALMSAKKADGEKLAYVLFQNMPNPFTKETTIRYALPASRDVSLKVYDITGRLVKTLVSENKAPGVYSVTWDGKDNTNLKLASGVYFIRFETRDYNQTKKAVLIK